MLFGQKTSTSTNRRPRALAPLSVGRHVFVERAAALAQGLDGVPLTDEGETTIVATLEDGREVEVIGWRQRPRVRYHIRCLNDDSTGWVWAEYLRPTREPVPVQDESAESETRSAAGNATKRSRSGPSRRAVSARELGAPVLAPQNEKPMPCSVCDELVHPYNLWRNSAGKIVGCFHCQGRASSS